MKITDILVHPMGMPAERVRWTAQEIARRVELTLVEVRTDAGIVGLGEISSGPQSAVCKLLDDMTPVIVGMDPLAIDAVWSKLFSITVPRRGGFGGWDGLPPPLARNQRHAAYDALPERLKTRIAPLKVEFSYGGRERKGIERLDPEDQKAPPAVYDMVRVHPETGRKSLYVNPTHVIRIVGIPEVEGDRLLAELYWYMLQPNAEYRHKWHAGDVVIWDNRCTVHSAAGGHPSSERRVHWRTTVMQ